MKQQSTIIPMPILEANENNYQDCVMILRAYEKCIREIYHNAGMLGIFIYVYKQTHTQNIYIFNGVPVMLFNELLTIFLLYLFY